MMDREQLVLDHLWLPRVLAWKAYPYESFEDKLSDGMYGLVLAARSFYDYDPPRATFATYARHRVQGAIADGYRKRHGTRRMVLVQEVSLDEHNAGRDDDELSDGTIGVLPSHEDDSVDRLEVSDLLDGLSEQDKQICRGLAGLERLEDVARRQHVTPSRISQRKNLLLRRLRHRLKEAC